jgi:hypothetical protein
MNTRGNDKDRNALKTTANLVMAVATVCIPVTSGWSQEPSNPTTPETKKLVIRIKNRGRLFA